MVCISRADRTLVRSLSRGGPGRPPTRGFEVVIVRDGAGRGECVVRRDGPGGGRHGGLGRAVGEQQAGEPGQAGQGTACAVDVVHEDLC
jgi:hypothetical protein